LIVQEIVYGYGDIKFHDKLVAFRPLATNWIVTVSAWLGRDRTPVELDPSLTRTKWDTQAQRKAKGLLGLYLQCHYAAIRIEGNLLDSHIMPINLNRCVT